MPDIFSMRERTVYLHRQAAEFGKLGEHSPEPLRAEFFELANRCDEIAANIQRNLPIHGFPNV